METLFQGWDLDGFLKNQFYHRARKNHRDNGLTLFILSLAFFAALREIIFFLRDNQSLLER